MMSPLAAGRSPFRKPQPSTSRPSRDLSRALARLLGWGAAPLCGLARIRQRPL